MTRKSKYTIEFEKRFGDKLKSRSISNLSRFFKIKKSILQDAFNRGVGAFKNNRAAVREGVTSAEQWAFPRMLKLILNVVDEKIPTGRGQDGDLVEKALNV